MTGQITPVGTEADRYHRGPSLGALAIVYTVLFVASLVTIAAMTGGAHYPTPYDPPELARAYYARYADAHRIASFFLFGSAIPLGLFTATITSRLRFLGVTVAGVSIALFGGIAAAILLGISALTGWVLSQPSIAGDAGSVRILQLFAFAAGGPGHIVPLGLLLAGVSVPAGFFRLLPRWLVVLGLILAGIGELSALSLVWPLASFLLPLCRMPAFVWLIGAGFALPKARRSDSPMPGAPPEGRANSWGVREREPIVTAP
jgi:hypothetical protein